MFIVLQNASPGCYPEWIAAPIDCVNGLARLMGVCVIELKCVYGVM